ncbi:Gfo/Idh/MocA family oxidoreductase [Opitutales bacterium ASA1]|uniref:Gfo/Idh/MocA family oxidoreductase n=1 Tax=Congregicoccus parvus TaxID=3081749 RepID=UPI002B2B127F|nr:Gfo/Idh/MocA family oxidoreductase [Opitutales bacterium ASA1]
MPESPRTAPPPQLSRRGFCRLAAGSALAATFPLILPRRMHGASAPSNRIRVAQIGCGRIARGHDMPGVLESGLADIVAVCDVDSRRAAAARDAVLAFYRKHSLPTPDVAVYRNYEEMVVRDDVDAVVISTPDHQHARNALLAIRAGKDVYLQKPFTMTQAEGVMLCDAVQRHRRILQVGSQQRSWGPSEQFRKACEFVRSGRIGRLQHVEIGLPTDPTKPDDPEQPVPAHLDYDAWLGPTPHVYYTEQRVHSQKLLPDGTPDVGSRPGWLRNDSYCLGMITGWGAHHFDTAHWGMDMESSGPLRVEGRGEFPTNEIWNVHGAYHVELAYPGDVRMTVSNELPNGIKFIGDEGWIFCTRESEAAQTASDPTGVRTALKPLDASDPHLLDPAGVSVQFLPSTSHHRNWLDCVKSRQTPLAPASVAHSANNACIVSWIAMKLGRPLRWDSAAERFIDDPEANALLSRPERAPYGVGAGPRV